MQTSCKDFLILLLETSECIIDETEQGNDENMALWCNGEMML
jgi:hypothetical protein